MPTNKYYSDRQEHMIADYLGWSVVSGSGARSTLPGDIRSEDWLGECKTHKTPGQMISFKHKVWKKIQDEASSKFKFPALFVDDGSQTVENTWVMHRRFTACKFAKINVSNILSEFPLVDTLRYPELGSVGRIMRVSDESINFDTSSLLDNRRKVESYIPVIYHVGWRSKENALEWVNISTLEDFHFMFVKYGG